MSGARVLVVEDDEAMGMLLVKGLIRRQEEAVRVANATQALEKLSAESFDAVVTDLNMPGLSGVELCARLRADHPSVPVIVMTAFGSLEAAIASIRAGAYDFLPKPVQEGALHLAVTRAVEHRRLSQELRRLRQQVATTRDDGGLIGESSILRRSIELIDRISESEATVLIAGESGTGKEVAARRIHASSPRRSGPFVAINCAAMPEALLESELFGHVKGAFTDARSPRAGLFVQASGGTLFLDELGELPLPLQPKLLRALQERKVRPVGSDVEVPFDARVVSATNRDLEAEIEAGRFREDLFFRINVITIDLPPLRLRGNDVLLLAQHFLGRHEEARRKGIRGVSVEAAKRLTAYPWPGNVRELQNCIERAVAFAEHDELVVGDLPEKIAAATPQPESLDEAEIVTLDENERRYVARVLAAVGGNRSHAARLLGIDRKSLWRRLNAPQGSG